MFWEVLGAVATLCIIVSYLPQVVKSYRTKKMDDISLVYLSIIAFGVFLWMLYGFHIQDAVVFYANILILINALLLVSMKIYYSKKS